MFHCFMFILTFFGWTEAARSAYTFQLANNISFSDPNSVINAFALYSGTLISGDQTGSVLQFDLATLKLIGNYSGHSSAISSIVTTSSFLYTADVSGTVLMWNARVCTPPCYNLVTTSTQLIGTTSGAAAYLTKLTSEDIVVADSLGNITKYPQGSPNPTIQVVKPYGCQSFIAGDSQNFCYFAVCTAPESIIYTFDFSSMTIIANNSNPFRNDFINTISAIYVQGQNVLVGSANGKYQSLSIDPDYGNLTPLTSLSEVIPGSPISGFATFLEDVTLIAVNGVSRIYDIVDALSTSTPAIFVDLEQNVIVGLIVYNNYVFIGGTQMIYIYRGSLRPATTTSRSSSSSSSLSSSSSSHRVSATSLSSSVSSTHEEATNTANEELNFYRHQSHTMNFAIGLLFFVILICTSFVVQYLWKRKYPAKKKKTVRQPVMPKPNIKLEI